MQNFSRDPQTERSLQHSLKDAAGFAVMTGIGETYLSAFALFLKATTPQMGLLAAIPPLLASVMQLLSARLGRRGRNRKRIIISGTGMQAISWIPLITLPLLFPEHAIPLLIGCVIIYQCGAHLATPQWTSLMGDILPARRRGRFFAFRTRVSTALTFSTLVVGGLVLQFSTQLGNTLAGFIVLFVIAAFARVYSVWHLNKMHEPERAETPQEQVLGRNWLQRIRESNAIRFSIFFALMQFAVSISAPFFTVFMLRDLQLSYLAFTANTATAIFVQFLTLTQWGRIGDIFGNRRILLVTGISITILPILWLPSSNLWYLICIQAFSGFAWAGFNLGASNFVYDLMSPDRRASYLAVHNVLASIGIFFGAIFGGYLGLVLPTQLELFGQSYSWLSPLCGVFVASALARGIIVAILIPKLREAKQVRNISYSQLIFRVMRVNALAGVVFEIIGTRPRKP